METVTIQEVTRIALDIPRFIEYSLILLAIGFCFGRYRK